MCDEPQGQREQGEPVKVSIGDARTSERGASGLRACSRDSAHIRFADEVRHTLCFSWDGGIVTGREWAWQWMGYKYFQFLFSFLLFHLYTRITTHLSDLTRPNSRANHPCKQLQPKHRIHITLKLLSQWVSAYVLPHPMPTHFTNTPQSDFCLFVLAVFLPPLAVIVRRGCRGSFWLNILLTILGWLPGVIHAWYIILRYPTVTVDRTVPARRPVVATSPRTSTGSRVHKRHY